MAGSSGKSSGKSGGGQASNADLQDDEDFMSHRHKRFNEWMDRKKKTQAKPGFFMCYDKSPDPPRRSKGE